jgi:hypothetical protein
MTLKVVGAGLGRTGTHSLQLALQTLLGGPCYHMVEVFDKPDHIAMWQAAAEGKMPDWDVLFEGYVAGVDWPVGAYWRELAAHYPDAPILLSSRDADSWWKSASNTIFVVGDREAPTPEMAAQMEMATTMLTNRFTPGWRDEAEAKQAFEAHNAAVRAEIPADRLIDWRPGDGWRPICDKLGLPVPEAPFPHVNTTAEFRAMLGLDG